MKQLLAAIVLLLSSAAPALAADKPAAAGAFARVMDSGTLRCGYIIYSPVVLKDLKTGAMSGILVDIMDEVGRRLSLKIDWNEEIPFVTQFEGLKSGRYDVICTAMWGWAEQAKLGEFIGPMYFYPLGIWVRQDDSRFDSDRQKINDPAVTVSGVDGTFPLDAARQDFPKAKVLALPQSADYAQPLMDVATGKADVTFIDNNMGLDFVASNPGSLKNIAADPPYKIFGNFVMVNKGEHDLQTMLQNVVDLMILDGTVDGILKKYESGAGAYYRVPRPYEAPR